VIVKIIDFKYTVFINHNKSTQVKIKTTNILPVKKTTHSLVDIYDFSPMHMY
jgi:hypothetical protein